MENDFRLIHPSTFVDGEDYHLKERFNGDSEPALIPVCFIAYDPCPAFIRVSNGSSRQRCLRDDLFAYSNTQRVVEILRKPSPVY